MLRGLDRTALEELLVRRPEATESLKGPSPAGFEDLARVLSHPHLIVRTVDQLDLFRRQLLALAVWLGPAASRDEVERQAAGVRWVQIERAAADLARWGLAFPEGTGRDWRLLVPNCVSSLFRAPAGLGLRAKELLGGRTKEALTEILRALGGSVPSPARKEAILTGVVERLSDPGVVTAVVEQAPEEASKLLATIREEGEPVSAGTIMAEGFAKVSPTAWYSSYPIPGRRREEDPLEWLQRHGLVVGVGASYDYSGPAFAVPAEAELSLRGGVVFDRWHPEPPQIDAVEVPPALWQPDGAPAEVQALLDEWALRRPPALQKGGLGVRELRRSAKALGLEERRVQFLYALAAELGLLAVERAGGAAGEVVIPSDEAATWGRLAPAEQWDQLFRAWFRVRLWTDIGDGGLTTPDRVRTGADEPVRRAVVGALVALPQGTGAAARDVARSVLWAQPTLMHCLECGTVAVERAAEGLAFLGTGTAEPPSLGQPARAALEDPRWHAGEGEAAALFHQPVDTCVVQADLRIIVPGPPARALAEALIAFADLEASAPARVYRLSDRSIGRALDAGTTAGEILDALRVHAPKGVPQNVGYLIEDVARRHGNLVVGRAGLYVRSEDPGLIAEIAADRRLAGLRPRLLAPTVVSVSDTSLDALLKALRAAGYLPVAERDGEGAAVARGSAAGPRRASGPGRRSRTAAARGRRTPTGWDDDEEEGERPASRYPLLFPIPPRSRGPAVGLDRTQAAALAERLASARRPGTPRVPGPEQEPAMPPGLARSKRDVTDLVRLAVEERLVLRIAYVNARGRETVRDIEPLMAVGGGLDAWCRLRTDLRNFSIGRIRWAEATGETFEHGLTDRLQEPLDFG